MKEIVAVLLDIRSVHNVGSMFRTADGAGIKKMYLCGITPTPLDRFGKVREEFKKVALGAEQSVAWEQKKSAARLLERLKREGFVVAAVEQSPRAMLHADFRKNKKAEKVALVVGNEVDGVPERILRHADVILEIPMRGQKESLNVSVAFGVVAYGIQY